MKKILSWWVILLVFSNPLFVSANNGAAEEDIYLKNCVVQGLRPGDLILTPIIGEEPWSKVVRLIVPEEMEHVVVYAGRVGKRPMILNFFQDQTGTVHLEDFVGYIDYLERNGVDANRITIVRPVENAKLALAYVEKMKADLGGRRVDTFDVFVNCGSLVREYINTAIKEKTGQKEFVKNPQIKLTPIKIVPEELRVAFEAERCNLAWLVFIAQEKNVFFGLKFTKQPYPVKIWKPQKISKIK